MAITFVHALWGDELVATWPKSLRDVQWGCAWRNKPPIGKTLVFAYGAQNYRWLECYGFSPILASEDSVVDFDGAGNRELNGRSKRGVINYGISMWAHKSHAIQLAFAHGADEVLWLDWDTSRAKRLPKEPTEEQMSAYHKEAIAVLESLKDGPDFQGRVRHYKQLHSAGGYTRDVYHGGCYYLRSPKVFEEMDMLRRARPYVTDEALVTEAVCSVYFDGENVPAQRHRDAGMDNPRLHACRVNAVASEEVSLYFEGAMTRSPPFECEMRTPVGMGW